MFNANVTFIARERRVLIKIKWHKSRRATQLGKSVIRSQFMIKWHNSRRATQLGKFVIRPKAMVSFRRGATQLDEL